MKDKDLNYVKKMKHENVSTLICKSIKSIFGLVRPGAQIVALYENYTKYTNQKEVIKLYEFLKGIGDEDASNMIEALGPEYASEIIDCVISEVENKKSIFYQNLVVNLMNGKEVDFAKKSELVIILKDMTFEDIQLAKKYYIYNKYDIKGFRDSDEQIDSLLPHGNGLSLKSTNKLVSNGLVFIGENKTWKSDKYQSTDLLDEFITMIHTKNDLSPKNSDLCVKDKLDAIIGFEKSIIDGNEIKNDKFISDLSDRLRGYLDDTSIDCIVINDLDFEVIRKEKTSEHLIKIIFNNDYTFFTKRYMSEDEFVKRTKINSDEDDVYKFNSDEKSIQDFIESVHYDLHEAKYDN
ncbi:hypothetical protein ACWATV_002536 [Morganella morganii]